MRAIYFLLLILPLPLVTVNPQTPADNILQEASYSATFEESVSPVISELALAESHKQNLAYDKACAIYKKLAAQYPSEISYLVSCADTELLMGKEDEALHTYEQVLLHDKDNLAANVYVGNYYYLRAENKKESLQNEYNKISSPSRNDHANFRKSMHHLFTTDYSIAKTYLENVVKLFPSSEAKRNLDKIETMEKYFKAK